MIPSLFVVVFVIIGSRCRFAHMNLAGILFNFFLVCLHIKGQFTSVF